MMTTEVKKAKEANMANELAKAAEPVTVQCAFCEGSGKDPFGVLSSLSSCPACGGKGTIHVRSPYVRCSFCQGSGVHHGTRLTCSLCGGTGMRHVRGPTKTCPNCLGSGVEPRSEPGRSCFTCMGKGVVEERM